MIRAFFRKLDIYPQTINFTINGVPKYKTSVGGVLTMLILVLFIFLIFNFSYDYTHRLNPALFTQTIIDVDNHYIEMNNPFTNIILQPFRKDRINDFILNSSLFYIQVENASYIQYTDGRPRQNNFTNLGIKRCNISDFHESLHDYYKINNFNKSFCVNKNYLIKGSYTSNLFQFLKIWVRGCVGIDSLTGEKVTCINDSNAVQREVSNWKISLYLTYAIPNPSNFTHPFQNQIFNKAFVFYPAIDTRENYFLSKDIVSTDDDLFPTGRVSNTTVPNYFGQDTAVTYNNLEMAQQEWSYFHLFFRTYTSYNLLKRTYKKLPDILAGTISMVQFIHVTFILIYPFYNIIPFRLDIINSTFHKATSDEIYLRKEIKKIIESTAVNQESNKKVNSNIPPTTVVFNSELQLITHNIKGNFLTKKKTKIERFKDNNISHKIKTGSLFCNKLTCRKNKNIIVYDYFNQIINNKLEFKKYLGIYEDLERIKDLILDDSQKIVFDHWLRKYTFDNNNNINSNWLQEIDVSNKEILDAVNIVNNRIEKTKIDYSILSSLDI